MSRSIRKPGHRAAWIVAGALALGTIIGAPSVTAAPTATIAEVEAQIQSLQSQAEIASENLNGARLKLADLQQRKARSQAKATHAEQLLAGESRSLGQMANEAYRSGGMDASVQVLMADNPADFLQQSASLEIVAKTQNAVLRRATAARLDLAQATLSLSQQEAEAAAVEQDMANQKAAIESSLQEQQRVLSQLQEEQRRQLEAARKATAEAEARAAAEAQAAADRAARLARAREVQLANNADTTGTQSGAGASTGGQSSGQNNPGPPAITDSGGSSTPAPAPSHTTSSSSGYAGTDQAAIAVAYALSQVGKPYSFDAQPPDSWDCSKLTAAAWAQAGVSLTAYSYDQANEVRRISVSELRPGDLLFYFNNAHHVAMYIGNGQIVEAANPSVGVHVTDAWNSWSSSAFSFAGRPVG